MIKPGLFGGEWDAYLDQFAKLSGDGDNRTDAKLASTAPALVNNPNDGAASGVPSPIAARASGNGRSAHPQQSSVWDDLLDAGKAIWTSPNTALGLVAGMAGLPFGARPTFEHGAVVFNNYPWQVHGGGAVTLGNTILSTEGQLTPQPTYTYAARLRPPGSPLPPNPYVDMGKHEEGHVRQAGILGPLYLPTYLAQSAFSNGPSPMEKAADIYGQTGKGWWPW